MADRTRPARRAALIFALAWTLAACGGGSDSTPAGQEPSPPAPPPPTGTGDSEIEVAVSGSVGDGPIAGAHLAIYTRGGEHLAEYDTDSTASADYTMQIKTKGSNYALTVTASGGTDLVTGAPPDFVLKAALVEPSRRMVTNINPFTSLIVDTAMRSGGLTRQTVPQVRDSVVQRYGFGLDTALIPDPMAAPIDETNVANMVKSSETLGEVIRRTRDALQTAGANVSADAVVAALSADLVDGVVDGRGVAGADARIAAVANTSSAQVLIESFSNTLKVGGVDAMAAMDTAILSVRPDTSLLTRDVRIPGDALAQAHLAVLSANALAKDSSLEAAAATFADATAGSRPSALAPRFDASAAAAAAGRAVERAAYGTDDELEAVNAVARSGGQSGGGENPPENAAPVISGNPSGAAQVGSSYEFAPSATDADGDVLDFAITGKPGWASFDNATGRLSGTPAQGDVGTWGGIVIAVSDGQASAELPPFTIEVTEEPPPPNSPPSISGAPGTSVEAGTSYSFTPSATDPDGDALSFAIAGKPYWGSFNTSTGRLSGTPGSSDTATYGGIVISVGDGQDSAALPSFSITVTEPPPTTDYPAAQLHTAEWSGSNVYLAWSYPGSLPPGGFDIVIDGVDTNNTYRTTSLEQTVGPLSGASHCFSIDARYPATNTFPESNTLCVEAQGGGGTNGPPTIGGNPPASISVGEAYEFTPTASDPDGDTLEFSVTNLPPWATFSASTGRISGSPAASHEGTWSNVRITVSDGEASAELGPFSIEVVAVGTRAITVSWTPPTQREDGTPLNGLAGYRIHRGTAPDQLTLVEEVSNGGISSYVLDGIVPGTWYIAVAAYDSSGMQSRLSEVITAVVN